MRFFSLRCSLLRSISARTFRLALGLALVACAATVQTFSERPIALGGTTLLSFQPPLRTTGYFHDFCLTLPAGYRVDLENQELVASSGERGALAAELQADSGLLFKFDVVSLRRIGEADAICLRSQSVVGRKALLFVKGKVLSTLRWSSPRGVWVSVVKG